MEITTTTYDAVINALGRVGRSTRTAPARGYIPGGLLALVLVLLGIRATCRSSQRVIRFCI